MQELQSTVRFPQEPTAGNENASLLTASFTSITTLLNKITNDPPGTIGICPLGCCYADKVEGNIRALKGDAENIARKTQDLDLAPLIESIKSQFYELENQIRMKLPRVNHLDLRSPIESALAGEDPEVVNEGIFRIKDDIAEYIGLVCEGLSGLMTTAQEKCEKKINDYNSTIEDIKSFSAQADAAFEPPLWTALFFNLLCSYPTIKDQIDDGLQKSQSVLESTADLSVLKAIRDQVRLFPLQDISSKHQQF